MNYPFHPDFYLYIDFIVVNTLTIEIKPWHVKWSKHSILDHPSTAVESLNTNE